MTKTTSGKHLDLRVLDHFKKTGEILPEVLQMSADGIEELIGSVDFPPELNTALGLLKDRNGNP